MHEFPFHLIDVTVSFNNTDDVAYTLYDAAYFFFFFFFSPRYVNNIRLRPVSAREMQMQFGDSRAISVAIYL